MLWTLRGNNTPIGPMRRPACKSPTAISRQAFRSALRAGVYDEIRAMIPGLVIFDPFNPHRVPVEVMYTIHHETNSAVSGQRHLEGAARAIAAAAYFDFRTGASG